MSEIELMSEKLSEDDNSVNVEMFPEEIWFIKYFIENYNPKKIVEIGVSAGGNSVNLLKWKNKDAQLFSVDIAQNWYKDETKLSGFMADEVGVKENYKIYRGYDYLDVLEEIGDGIDFIIIDTVHVMPGEFLTFLAALPQLKDGCIVILHDIHLNSLKISLYNLFRPFDIAEYCTGLLYAGVSSNKKFSLKQTNEISNIGAFIVDESTRDNIKDVFRILCCEWYYFPDNLNIQGYFDFIEKHYPIECYNLFKNCFKFQQKYFNHKQEENKQKNNKLNKDEELIKSLEKENKSLNHYKNENEIIKSTVSWKITKPLRYLSKLIK